MKNKKLVTIIGALTLSAAMLLSGCGSTAGNQKQETTEAAVEQASEATPEATESVNATIPGSESQYADQCKFVLEGKEYTLPFDYSVLEADGWQTSTDMSQSLDGLTYTFVYINKDGKPNITVDVFNGSGNSKKLSECKVTSIKFKKAQLSDYSFELGNGLKPGDDKDAVEKVMGAPTESNEYDEYLTNTYGKSRDEGEIEFTWWKDEESKKNGEDQIEVSYMLREETASSSEVPDYLSEYTAPAAIGDDFDSSTFSLGGVVYQLPCPTSEFIKNGWTLTETQDVMAGRTGYGTLEKDGVKLRVDFKNFADYQTDGSNCAISEIEASAYGDNPVPDFTVPKGLSLTTGKADLEAALKTSAVEFSSSDSDSYISYNYGDYDKGCSASFYFDKDENKITHITIGGENWPGK